MKYLNLNFIYGMLPGLTRKRNRGGVSYLFPFFVLAINISMWLLRSSAFGVIVLLLGLTLSSSIFV